MNALQIASNSTFMAVALQEAIETLSKSTGISVESLVKQFPTNSKLQESVAKLVSEAAKVMADELNK